MLKISTAQMGALDAVARENFRWRLVRFLTTEMPKEMEVFSEREIYERVVQYELAAAPYGIETEQGIALFTSLSFALGGRADEVPEIQEYLNAKSSVDPEERLERLVDMLPEP